MVLPYFLNPYVCTGVRTPPRLRPFLEMPLFQFSGFVLLSERHMFVGVFQVTIANDG